MKFIEKLYDDVIDTATYEATYNPSEKVEIPYSEAKELYHYCSLESFYSIIESNCFWLSHPKFMNDLSEQEYAIGTTKKFLQEYIQNINEKDNSRRLLKLIGSKFELCESKFKGFDEDKYKKHGFFTCFSSDGDSLPMWSMYKGKNIGLAIGLDFSDEKYFVDLPVSRDKDSDIKKISPFYNPPHYYFSDIEYQEDIIKKSINIFLDHIRNYYNSSKTELNNDINYAENYLASKAAFTLMTLSLDLKNSNFNYEKETRLILLEYKEEDVKFRVKDKFIVPYIEFPLEEKKEVEDGNEKKIKKKFDKPIIPIKSITISPNAEEPELVKASIWAFLNHKGYKIDKKQIIQSPIPYKPR